MFAASKTDGSAVAPDAQFNYVTMLLHGDGTNGAQNNTFVDGSTNNFTITRNGNTTQGSFSPYGSNWSVSFDGIDDYLACGTQTAYSMGTGDFTMEAWVNFPSASSYRQIFSTRPNNGSSSANGSLGLSPTNGILWYTSGFIVNYTTSIGTNQWVHVAVSRSGTTLRVFVNGAIVGTATNSDNLTGSTLAIGANGDGSESFGGYISNARVVKGTAVYTSAFTPSTTPLTAISGTSLLTCKSNRFIDNSANAFAITPTNFSGGIQRFNPFGTSTAYSTSVIGGSGYFDGSGDYLTGTGSSNLAFGAGDFTIELWVYFNSVASSPAYQFLYSSADSSVFLNTPVIYWFQSSSSLRFNNGSDLISATGIQAKTWYHVAVSRSGTTTKMFLNGVQVGSVTDATVYINQPSRPMIGANGNGSGSEPFSGYISDVRCVKGTAVYTSAFTPPTAPLTAITNTQLLCNMTNGAIFDNAMMNDLETVGNAQISTSVKKYGTGSMYFDGTGDGLFTVSKPDLAFGTGDFTVEFWLYLAANLNTFAKVIQMGTSGNCFTIEAQGTANVLNVSNYTSTVYLTSNTALTTGTWIHVAVTRASGTLRIFQNGASVGGVSNSIDFPNVGGIYIGRSSTGQETNGYIDDLRITKGFARYTSAFTPPTSALSDTGPV